MYSAAPPAPATYSLWQHQRRFRQTAQQIAQALFEALDDDLHPYVQLVGLSSDPERPIGQEVGPGHGLPPEIFMEAMARVKVLMYTQDAPDNIGLDEEPISPAILQRRHKNRVLRAAVQERLDNIEGNTDYQYFSSWPVPVNGYYVFAILRLKRKQLRAYPGLQPNRFYTDGRPLANSLLVAAMYRFNEECVRALTEPEPGAGMLFRPRDTDELLRAAGRSLLDTPALAVGADDGEGGTRLMGSTSTGPGTERLFYIVNTISSLRYEGEEGVGCLLLARRGHPNLEEVFALTCPVELTDYRAVRKLLEMTTPNIHLLADAEKVYALGRQVGSYDASREDLFAFHFVTYYTWEFAHAGQTLMRSRYGLPGLARPRLSLIRFRRELKRTFTPHPPEVVERLWQVVLEASRQPKGTLLVITTEALAEADRLKLQCTLIEPVQLTPTITQLVTAIDGAVLLDPQGYCYSIGVILDGKASGHGNSTRGARYNSAVRYVDSSPYPCLTVVVSEDGMVDVLTKASLADDRAK